MLTGCRPAEAMKARWNQVDDEPGFWIKPSAHTKQRKPHKLALAPPALELLDRMRAGRQENAEWIFPGQARAITSSSSGHAGIGCATRAGIPGDRIYDLRHSFASIGAAGGLQLQVIGKLLGHTQARTTQRYAHLADDVMAAAAAKIGGTIHNAGNGHHKVTPIAGRG